MWSTKIPLRGLAMKHGEPLILSERPEDISAFKTMIEKTLDSAIPEIKGGAAFSGIDPYELRKRINKLGFLPEEGIGFDRTLELVKANILPNLLRTWSTYYMPHLHAPVLTETIAAELLMTIFNDSMDSWDQGPAATELEESVIHGMLKLYGYDKGADGTFTSGGTHSNLAAVTCARDWFCNNKLHYDIKKLGLPSNYQKFRLYSSEIAHFSMEKACHVLGLGYNAVRKVPVDSKFRIDLGTFEKMLKEDVAAGLIPFCAVATIGTTDFGTVDSVEGMRKLCDKYGMYLHADASYGSAAVMSRKYSSRIGNLSLADSITVDFHKMFLLPISCSVILLKNSEDFKCFELHADYLNREEDEEEGYINLVGKSMQTTRRFDALKVFMAFQTRGRDGFAEMVDTLIENATYFYEKISADPAFIAPVASELSSVVFARRDGDEANKKIRKTLLSEGVVIGQTKVSGKVMLKFTLLNPNITHKQIDEMIEHIKSI